MSSETSQRGLGVFSDPALADSFETLLGLDWRRSEFALAGSSSLHLLSQTALSRGHAGLLTREPHDLDIIVTGDAKRFASEKGISSATDIGRGYLISLRLDGDKGKLLDVTTQWPVGPTMKNAHDLSAITYDVEGIRVLKEQYVFELKEAFNRAKDKIDLTEAMHAFRTAIQVSSSSGITEHATEKVVEKLGSKFLSRFGGAAGGLGSAGITAATGANASEVAAAAIPGGQTVLAASQSKFTEAGVTAIEEVPVAGGVIGEVVRVGNDGIKALGFGGADMEPSMTSSIVEVSSSVIKQAKPANPPSAKM